jgi:hypothetical protein
MQPSSTALMRSGEAKEAKEATKRRRHLPNEAVQLSDGSSRTRGQVYAGHDDRLAAAAQRERAGTSSTTPSHPASRSGCSSSRFWLRSRSSF